MVAPVTAATDDEEPPPPLPPSIAKSKTTGGSPTHVVAKVARFMARSEQRSHELFYAIGVHVANWPKLYISSFLIWTLLMSAGIVRFREVNNVRDHFSATNSPSRYELAVAREFFQELGSPFHVVVALRAADQGNILRPGYLEKALEIEDYLQYKLNVTHRNETYAYSDFCGTQCETSDAVNIFLTMFRDVQTRKTTRVKITYPTMDVFGHKVYLANNIFNVVVNNRSSLVEEVGLIAINFHAIYNNKSMHAVMTKWEHAVFDFTQTTLHDPLINVYTTSEGLVSEEVRRTGLIAMPLMSITFIVILVFTIATTFHRDLVRCKPFEAAFGVLCPLLSIVASFGHLFWMGFEFLPIVTVVPFLVLAIGVDDVFIFMHSWHLARSSDPKSRTGDALAEAGPSITITSLTNLLSFSIGILTPTPAIQTFCVFISLAVIYDYLYQIFLFSAVMYLGGKREYARRNAVLWCLTVPEPEKERPEEEGEQSSCLSALYDRLLDWWTDVAMWKGTRYIVAVILLVFWTMMAKGAMSIQVGLKSEKLFMDDSPLLELVRLQTDVIFKEGGQIAVFVNSPGNLSEPDAVPEIMRILNRFETAKGAVGSASTQMWLLPYLPFIGLQNRGSIEFKYRYLPDFFKIQEYRRWSHFVNLGDPRDCLEERPSCLSKFVFSTGFHNAVAWTDRLELLNEWRSLAAEYPHLNLTIYEDFSMYADQLLSIVPVTRSTVICALLCMIAVLCLFTPCPVTILTSTFAILSINLGVFGSLAYAGVDLDPISMTTTLMAIGFSVDFVAHITFHYYKGDANCRRERLRSALAHIAWPMVQASSSTILSLLVLCAVHAYMVQVFVLVVVLVVSLGVLHGLVVLPVFFTALPFTKNTEKRGDDEGTPDHRPCKAISGGGNPPVQQQSNARAATATELNVVRRQRSVDAERA